MTTTKEDVIHDLEVLAQSILLPEYKRMMGNLIKAFNNTTKPIKEGKELNTFATKLYNALQLELKFEIEKNYDPLQHSKGNR